MAIVHMCLLGGLRFTDANDQVIDLPVKKVMALFVYLAIQHEDRFPRSQLAQIFWPNSSERHARQSLRQAITDLRKHLPEFEQIFQVTRNTVTLQKDKLQTDVADFLEAARMYDFDSQAMAYQLYRGDFLAKLHVRAEPFFLWKEETTAALREHYIHVVEFLAEHNLLEGKTEKAIALNQELVELDPIRESAHRCLISLYATTGQGQKAEEQYSSCCRILEEKLNTGPEERTTRTYQCIKEQASSSNSEPIKT